MKGEFTEEQLVQAGLYQVKAGLSRPQPQLCGLGNTGKKNAKGEVIWGWTHPILIPYFGREGEVVCIRPHKGGIPGQPSLPYVARVAMGFTRAGLADRAFKPARVVVTEGEFKSMALYWVFQGKVGSLALPGISQSKNPPVVEGLKEWIREECRVEKLVVSFDSEEKGDPKLPGFKPEKRRRFDAEIWARYLAYVLEKEFHTAKIGHLPKEWRDANGKVDWDGTLARVMKGEL
jgi:hypothetical protein